MELIIRPRQAGKTYEMIRRCHEDGGYIVTINRQEARRIFVLAQELEMPVPFPLVLEEWAQGKLYGHGIKQFYFDNLDLIIQSLSRGVPVAAATWTDGSQAGDVHS